MKAVRKLLHFFGKHQWSTTDWLEGMPSYQHCNLCPLERPLPLVEQLMNTCKEFKDHKLKDLWYYSFVNNDYRNSDFEYCVTCKEVVELTEFGYIATGKYKTQKFFKVAWSNKSFGDISDIREVFP